MQPAAPFDQFDMTGRTVVVTGGTRGIGLALTEAYVAAGANVVVASRKAEACAEVADRLGPQVLGVPTHMGDLDDVAALADRAAEHRTPLLMQCIDDYLGGRRFPLELLYAHESVLGLGRVPSTVQTNWAPACAGATGR